MLLQRSGIRHPPPHAGGARLTVTVPRKVVERPRPGSRALGTDSRTRGPMPAYTGPLMAYPHAVLAGTQPDCAQARGREDWGGVSVGGEQACVAVPVPSALPAAAIHCPHPAPSAHLHDAVLLVACGARVAALLAEKERETRSSRAADDEQPGAQQAGSARGKPLPPELSPRPRCALTARRCTALVAYPECT